MPNIQLFKVQAFQKVAYEVHRSDGIYFVNGWVDGVNSYHPPVNSTNVHPALGRFRLRAVTVEFDAWTYKDDAILRAGYLYSGSTDAVFVYFDQDRPNSLLQWQYQDQPAKLRDGNLVPL